MPPRKSNVSAVSTTNEDGTPTKETKDGVNIEVNNSNSIYLISYLTLFMALKATAIGAKSQADLRLFRTTAGPLSPKDDGAAAGQGRSAGKHPDTEGRYTGDAEGRNGVCELLGSGVCEKHLPRETSGGGPGRPLGVVDPSYLPACSRSFHLPLWWWWSRPLEERKRGSQLLMVN